MDCDMEDPTNHTYDTMIVHLYNFEEIKSYI